MSTGYIDDGYTFSKRIEATDFHPVVNVTYRPAVGPKRRAFLTLSTQMSTADESACEVLETRVCNLIAGQVVEWDIKNREGKVVEVSGESVARLAPDLCESLISLVYSFEKPDGDGDKTAKN